MKKFGDYVSNLRVLEQVDKENLDNEFIKGWGCENIRPRLLASKISAGGMDGKE